MPNTLPVPSKAALRTLRRIALGTSCTVAFTTGLLTEDRRRRIHAAREVHNNAKLLKSSRKYHSSASPSAESFEEQAMRYNDDGLWLRRDSLNHQSAQVALPQEYSTPVIPVRHQELPPFKVSKQELPPPSNILRRQPQAHTKTPQALTPVLILPTKPAPSQVLPPGRVVLKPEKPAWTSCRHRQKRLAKDVTNILENEDELSNTEAAASRFFEAFAEGLGIEESGLVQQLIDAAAQLSKACQLAGNFDASDKIVEIITSYGPTDETVFHSLGVEGIVQHLLKEFDGGMIGNIKADAPKLHRAVALYLTKFKEKPQTSHESWLTLGESLCAATYRYELFGLTEQVYWRLEMSRGDAPNRCFHHLVAALYQQDRHKEIVKVFRRLSCNARLNRPDFLTTGDSVIESALQIRRLDLAEEALFSLIKTAEDARMVCPRHWFLKVLGGNWRAHGDISQTRALFKRLEPHFYIIVNSRPVYGAIIQFCIEAGDEAAARWYYEQNIEKAPPMASLIAYDMRIHGHFAYAKAMRSDWPGVKEDFRRMGQLSSHRIDLSHSFTTIFKLFAKSHPVNETEEFIRTFIDEGLVDLTPYMSTTMINNYGAVREIDSISRWLDYMISVQSPADAVFFNSILHNCRTTWKFSFEETYQLFQDVRKVGTRATKFINQQTISILRHAAMADSGRDVAKVVLYLNRLKLDHPLTRPMRSEDVQLHMAVALAKGHPRRALRIYERAQNDIIPLDGVCISKAVQATLRIDPSDIHGAACLLRKPQKNGRDISSAVAIIFVHQLSHQRTGYTRQVLGMARSTISILEERGVEVHPSVLTHTMHTLVSRQQYYEAVDFWKSMTASGKTPRSLNLRTLTVLLQAYVGARDSAGIQWVIHMLSVHKLSPDHCFKDSLKRALNAMKKVAKSQGYECVERRFYNMVKIALARVSDMRREATQDREHVKTMTITIMEKAIEIDRMLDSVKTEGVSKDSFQPSAVDEENVSPSASEDSLDTVPWTPFEEPDHYLPPVGKLVGAQAG